MWPISGRPGQEKTEKATEEYRKYQAQNLSPVEEEYLENIKNIQSIAKKKVIVDRRLVSD